MKELFLLISSFFQDIKFRLISDDFSVEMSDVEEFKIATVFVLWIFDINYNRYEIDKTNNINILSARADFR